MEVSEENIVEEHVPVVEVKDITKTSKSPYVVGILLFLVVCLAGGLTYYILKDKGINLLGEDTDTEAVNTDISLENSTKTLYSLAEDGFSVEIPMYTLVFPMEDEDGTSVDVKSFWKVTYSKSLSNTFIKDFISHVSLSSPVVDYPEIYACDTDCMGLSNMGVSVYQNDGYRTLEDIKDEYVQNWEAEYGLDENLSLDGEYTTKWGLNVWKFLDTGGNGDVTTGYLVVAGENVYEVTTKITSAPEKAKEIADGILDSMKFGEGQ